jgi:pyrroloquinoline quinone biosynthesis protein B
VHVVVLGSSAGGGVPQWNCACANCQSARNNDGVKPRTQDSLAVSADGQRWFLLNVSPDVARQIESQRVLWPEQPREAADGARDVRHSPVAGAVLTNGDLDHCLGLLSLREWTPLKLYATEQTYRGLVEQNSMLRTLNRQRSHVVFQALGLDAFQPLIDTDGQASGLGVCAFPVAGKVPLHLESLQSSSAETNVGLLIEDSKSGVRLAYVPAAASTEGIAERTGGVSCLFFDGTFWSDVELSALGQVQRSARDMAHLPVGGPGGSLELLADLAVEHRYYTHLNNTNPMLRSGSRQRRSVEARGWGVAEDGLEIVL